VTRALGVRLAAEAAGTALLVGIGTGAIVASVGLGPERFVVLSIAWFLAVTIPVLLFAGVSGAHLNPLVSLALAGDRRIPWGEVLPHVIAQVAGAFLGSGAVAIFLGTGAHLGATVPSSDDIVRLTIDEGTFTFALIMSVLALVRAGPGGWRWHLLWPGAVVGVSTYLIGPMTGSYLNPARSLAPAVLSGTYPELGFYFLATTAGALLALGAVTAWERFGSDHRPTSG